MVDRKQPQPLTCPDAAAPSAPALLDALGHSMADKRLEVLRRLAHNGSISQAARDCGISYKAAWQALDTLTNLAGVNLVERSVGGAGGGGAALTEAGHTLLRAADAMEQARQAVLARLHSAGLHQPVLARLAVRTSMRNQWPCTVQALHTQGSKVRVLLHSAASSALPLQAHITRESAELMGLQPGLPVLAMAKATAVQVLPLERCVDLAAPLAESGHGTADSVWQGDVVRAATATDEEVAVRLPGGVHVVGFVAAAGRAALPPLLREGDAVAVCVPAAAVVLALVEAPLQAA